MLAHEVGPNTAVVSKNEAIVEVTVKIINRPMKTSGDEQSQNNGLT